MVKAQNLRIGQKIRHSLPGTEELEWTVHELTDATLTIRHDGFLARVLRYEDVKEEDVVATKLDHAIIDLKSAAVIAAARDIEPAPRVFVPAVRPARSMFCKHGYALPDGRCKREVCE